MSLVQSGLMMRLSADDAVIPRSPPERLSVEGSMVLIRVGSGIQVHRACTVYVRPSAASEGRREEVRCGRIVLCTHCEMSGGVNDKLQSVKVAAR